MKKTYLGTTLELAMGLTHAACLGGAFYVAKGNDAPIVFVERWIDAIIFRHGDAINARDRSIALVNCATIRLSKGRNVHIAHGCDSEIAAQTWGADAWRAGALDVVRLLPPAGFKTWGAAVAAAHLGAVRSAIGKWLRLS